MKRAQPPPLKAYKRLALRLAGGLRLARLGFGYPSKLVGLEQLTGKEGASAARLEATIHPPQGYAWRSPVTQSAVLGEEFERLRRGQLPAFTVSRFEQAELVSKNILLLPAGRQCVVAESAITPARFARTLAQDALKYRPARQMRGEYFLGFDRWSANYYYHWMVETLSRFLALDCLPTEVKILMPAKSASYMVRSLDLLGIAPERLVYFDNCRWRLEVCHFASKPYCGFTCSPAEIGELRRRFHRAVPAAKDGPTGLYVSRGKCEHRRLPNEAAVAKRLAEHGVSTVYAEDLDLDAKIALFRRARLVVAPFGSGLANLLFCEPGTRVVCFYDESFFDDCVYSLCEGLGLESCHLPLAADGSLPLDSLTAALESPGSA